MGERCKMAGEQRRRADEKAMDKGKAAGEKRDIPRSIRTYRDLVVWQKAMGMVTQIYRASQGFPPEETYGLTAQLRRSAVSVPSNIAEGHGRNATADYVRFLHIATGSLYEMQTQAEIALNLGYLGKEKSEFLYELSREVERMLSSLVRCLNAER
jgi:four helix bundle protein